jgi:hypothetical protein
METYGGVDVWIDNFFTPALVDDERSASHHDRVSPGERAVGIHCIGGWVDPRADLDDVEK